MSEPHEPDGQMPESGDSGDAAPLTAESFEGYFRESASAAPLVDTGRLFRSQGVEGNGDEVLAISPGQAGRLRTLDRTEHAGDGTVHSPDTATSVASAADFTPLPDEEQPVPSEPATHDRKGRSLTPRGKGLRASGIYLVVFAVTILAGFANALLSGGSLTWITGVALLASTTYAALTVRREDDIHAVLVAPLAFAAAALTAAQVFAGPSVQSILDRAVVFFFALADNWFWVIGSTLVAIGIVIVRRYRR